ncbi:MAG: DUF503 domain-containing protein [Polyangiaceae bacterium]
MFVGVLRLQLQIVGARSLKDKRSVVRSLKERAQARLRVSAAEIGDLDNPRHATLGFAVVSNSAAVCDEVLANVASMANTLPDAILADRATEIVAFGEGGRGVRGGIESMLGGAGGAGGDGDGDGDGDDGEWSGDDDGPGSPGKSGKGG